MPPDFRDMPRCKAISKSTQKRCGNPVVKGKESCYIHGGKANGPPKGSRNALKHGLYTEVLTRAEMARAAALKAQVNELDDEIVLHRMRLEMILKQEKRWLEEHGEDGVMLEEVSTVGMELAEYREEEKDEGAHDLESKKAMILKRPDFHAMVNRETNTIRRLVETRCKIMETQELRELLESLHERQADAEADQTE